MERRDFALDLTVRPQPVMGDVRHEVRRERVCGVGVVEDRQPRGSLLLAMFVHLVHENVWLGRVERVARDDTPAAPPARDAADAVDGRGVKSGRACMHLAARRT